MECERHQGNNVIFLCEECDNALVCNQCILESHNGHCFSSFEKEAERIRKKLKDKASENEQLVSDLDIQLQNIADAENEQKEASDNTNAQIQKTREDLHQLVDNSSDILLRTSDEKLQTNLGILKEQTVTISNQKERAMVFGTKLEDILNTTSALQVIMDYKKLEFVKIETKSCKIPNTLYYQESSINQNTMGDYFGTVVTSSHDDKESDFKDLGEPETGNSVACSSDFVEQKELNFISEFQHSQSNAVSVLTPYGRKHCLVKCKQETVIKLTDETGNVKCHFDLKSEKVRGIDKISDDSAYVCCVNPNCIKKITLPEGTESTLFSTEMSPLDIRCSSKREIFVALEKLRFLPSVAGRGKRVIVKYNDRGEELASVERDNFNIIIFKDPVALRINHAEDTIAVINEESNNLRYLVLLDWSLNVKLRYLGHRQVVPGDQKFNGKMRKEKFCVYDLAFNTNDDLLVCEEHSRSVQLLSPKCEILSTLFIDDLYAWSLAITDSGKIWIGRKDGRIKILG